MRKIKYSKNLVQNEASGETKSSIFKNKALWGLFIIVLMFGSVLSFGFFYKSDSGDNPNQLDYNGYKFVNNGQGWSITFNGQQVAFAYLPNEIEDVQIENFGFGFNDWYIAFKPEEFNEGSYEVNRLKSLLNLKGINVFPACLEENGCGNLPVIGCKENVILLKTSNETKGYWDKCYILESKQNEFLKVIDSFIYNVYGITKNGE